MNDSGSAQWDELSFTAARRSPTSSFLLLSAESRRSTSSRRRTINQPTRFFTDLDKTLNMWCQARGAARLNCQSPSAEPRDPLPSAWQPWQPHCFRCRTAGGSPPPLVGLISGRSPTGYQRCTAQHWHSGLIWTSAGRTTTASRRLRHMRCAALRSDAM